MFIVIYSLVVSFIISFFILVLSWFISGRFLYDYEKSSPFECGFDPKGSARIPFSMRFFLLAVVFLIFDVEIALILPFPFFLFSGFGVFGFFSCFIFMFILLFGVIYEWNEGSLDWIVWGLLV